MGAGEGAIDETDVGVGVGVGTGFDTGVDDGLALEGGDVATDVGGAEAIDVGPEPPPPLQALSATVTITLTARRKRCISASTDRL